MASDYIIDLEVDWDSGEVLITKESGYSRVYSVDELVGSGITTNALMANSDITIYAQSEQLTLDEFLFYYGIDLRGEM